MATNTKKRELSLNEQALNLAMMESVLNPEHILDRSRPLPYAFQHDPEACLRELVKLCDRDAWMTNDRR